MKVKIQQFLRQNHSWSVVGWNIARSLIKQGHDVHLLPTDLNYKSFMPENLTNYVKTELDGPYDMQLSYTALHNYGPYLTDGTKNRFGIYAYEFDNGFPLHYMKYSSLVNKILVPSNFVKQVLMNGKISENKLEVIPHGINIEDYNNKNKLKLKTKKKYKIGVVIGQPHLRKNLKGMLESYMKAFTKKDDVCLVVKINLQKGVNKSINVNFEAIKERLEKKYKNHAEIEMVTNFVEDMTEFYNAIDSVYTMSHGEGFYMPGLEALACGKLNIAPNHGGQLDFLNKNNSLLIDGKIVPAPSNYLYWNNSYGAVMFSPSLEHGAEQLYESYKNYDKLVEGIDLSILEHYTWDKIVSDIVNLCE